MTEWDTHLGDCVKYDAKEVDPDLVWDAIVIGSGIGGLTTASLLAQKGQRVLVLEQHWAAGGCMHTFESKGYRFGTGIHCVGSMHEGGKLKKILDTLTPRNDPVIWDRIEGTYEGKSCHIILLQLFSSCGRMTIYCAGRTIRNINYGSYLGKI